MKALGLLACSLAAGLAVVAVSAQDQSGASTQPVVLPLERYNCLVQYADQLRVSERGNTVDITRCPPRIANGFVPNPDQMLLPNPDQMNDYLTLNRADLDCLLRGRRANHGIAVMRGRNRVAVYLRPCGRR